MQVLPPRSHFCVKHWFRRALRMQMDDGRIGHAEIVYKNSGVRLASVWHESGQASPRDLAGRSQPGVLSGG